MCVSVCICCGCSRIVNETAAQNFNMRIAFRFVCFVDVDLVVLGSTLLSLCCYVSLRLAIVYNTDYMYRNVHVCFVIALHFTFYTHCTSFFFFNPRMQ